MDEMLLRAWDHVAKQMIYYDSVKIFDMSLSFFSGTHIECEPDNLIIERCTGLTDKNGAYVFEGDIATDGSTVVEIVWSSTHCWGCKVIKGGTLATGLTFPLWQWDDCPQNANRQLEVIGNIHTQEGE